MIIEKIYFGATDDVQLFGLLHKSTNNDINLKNQKDLNSGFEEQKSKKVVLSVHGMTSNCFKRREDIYAEEFTNVGIDYFCFNNRGSDIMKYFEVVRDGKLITRIEAGSAYEKFEESYHDVKGAIKMLLDRGYEDIYLQGHSYGSAKVLYTYNKLKSENEVEILKHIKLLTLQSIVDIARLSRAMLGPNFNVILNEVREMAENGKGEDLIKREYFLHPISANNFLFFTRINGPVDLVPFGDEKPDFTALNNVECPLIMLWGKDKDLIVQTPEELENIIKNNVSKDLSERLTIKFFEGTGHNYRHKEKEIAQFLISNIVEDRKN